jgi:hypothetical protein
MKSNNIIITSLFLIFLVAIVGCGNNGQNSNSNSLEGWVDNKNFKVKIVIEYSQA